MHKAIGNHDTCRWFDINQTEQVVSTRSRITSSSPQAVGHSGLGRPPLAVTQYCKGGTEDVLIHSPWRSSRSYHTYLGSAACRTARYHWRGGAGSSGRDALDTLPWPC